MNQSRHTATPCEANHALTASNLLLLLLRRTNGAADEAAAAPAAQHTARGAHLVRRLAAAKANEAPRDFFSGTPQMFPNTTAASASTTSQAFFPCAHPPAGLLTLPVHANSLARKRTFVGAAATPEDRDIQSRPCSHAGVHTGGGERNGGHERDSEFQGLHTANLRP